MEYLKGLAIVVVVVLFIYKLIDILLAKLGGITMLLKVRDLVADTVHAVEQTIDAPGEEKKQQALEYIDVILEKAKIDLDPQIIDLFLEAAVFIMNLSLKPKTN